MAIKTYGKIIYDKATNCFLITEAQPHVSIKLKHIFPRIPKTSKPPYSIKCNDQNSADLSWFMDRYPLEISPADKKRITRGHKDYVALVNEIEAIRNPNYVPNDNLALKENAERRPYQLSGSEIMYKLKRILNADDLGLGKTLTSIMVALKPGTLPAIAVVETHMPSQWKIDAIEKYTHLKVHIIKGTKPYSLPAADIYIIKYSCLSGWTNVFQTSPFKYAIFDECQALRKPDSQRYSAAKILSESVEYCTGLTATPVYNYGNEVYWVLDCIKPGCLGSYGDFAREWLYGDKEVVDSHALGSYLRESNLVLRRTRKEVGKELPPVNKIVHTVGYDSEEVKRAEDLARQLANKVLYSTSFMERGQAARELDLLARQTTGISKAREVAAYVRILLENGEKVVLAGWHREVYNIWLKELAEFKPVMYTGTETSTQKDAAKRKFIDGETDLFIISLRSGAGLDGLQFVCSTVVIGELDWSPKIHEQLIGRIDRPGQPDPVTAIYLVSEDGSDPLLIELLGLKSSQAHGIVDPGLIPESQHTDMSRMKALAEHYLKNKHGQLSF